MAWCLNSNWNNVGTNWYSGSASNLVNGSGGTTTAAVNCQGPSGAGTYWQVIQLSSTRSANGGNVDNVIVGPGGGDGDLASAITGIPYSNYEIIAYANDTNGAANMNMWLDGNPASSNSINAPRSRHQCLLRRDREHLYRLPYLVRSDYQHYGRDLPGRQLHGLDRPHRIEPNDMVAKRRRGWQHRDNQLRDRQHRWARPA